MHMNTILGKCKKFTDKNDTINSTNIAICGKRKNCTFQTKIKGEKEHNLRNKQTHTCFDNHVSDHSFLKSCDNSILESYHWY